MTSPVVPLLGSNLRTWLSAKGFWLVAAAALVPLVFTGAWVTSHRADVTAEDLQLPDALQDGDAVTFRAVIANTGPTRVDAFNATLAVGTVTAFGTLTPAGIQTVTVDGLDPGATREITLDWNATGGVYYVVAFADQDNAVDEVDEYDNQDARPLTVAHRAGGGAAEPTAPDAVNGDADANDTADLAVTALRVGDPRHGQPATLEAVVENRGAAPVDVNVTLRVHQVFQGATYPTQSRTTHTLQPGESKNVTYAWTAQQGGWWFDAYVEPPAGAREATPEDNHQAEAFAVDVEVPQDFQPPEIPERQTIKEFYLGVLELLHLQILIPFIALFYAGGVIADERDRGALPYVLTRPLPRWLIPLTKFVASFAVAAIALVVGLVLTYLLLFRTTPQGGDAGFLLTPLLVSLLTLFLYGAFFTLIGVWYPRPYLVGVAWVLGWEVVAYNFVPWVRNLTLQSHVRNALAAWPLDEGLQWLPTGEGGTRALLVIVGASIALLIAASMAMKQREFEV